MHLYKGKGSKDSTTESPIKGKGRRSRDNNIVATKKAIQPVEAIISTVFSSDKEGNTTLEAVISSVDLHGGLIPTSFQPGNYQVTSIFIFFYNFFCTRQQ